MVFSTRLASIKLFTLWFTLLFRSTAAREIRDYRNTDKMPPKIKKSDNGSGNKTDYKQEGSQGGSEGGWSTTAKIVGGTALVTTAAVVGLLLSKK